MTQAKLEVPRKCENCSKLLGRRDFTICTGCMNDIEVTLKARIYGTPHHSSTS